MERCSQWVLQQQVRQEDSNSSPPSDFPSDTLNLEDSNKQADSKKSSSDSGSAQSTQLKRKRQDSEEEGQENGEEAETSGAKSMFGKQRTRINESSIVFDLSCGWADCSFVCHDMPKFVHHVSYHVPDLETKEDEDGDDVYSCLWKDCDFESPNADEATRHVNYHSFHTKAKELGAYICKTLNLPPCLYGSKGCNYVPEQPDTGCCRWDSCNYVSNNINHFINHVNAHALDSDTKNGKLIECKWRCCTVSCFGRSRIISHLRTHTQEKPVACSVCGSLFASRTKLVDHHKAQTPVEKRTFQCSNCSRYYPSERLLRDHMRQHVNHYKCRFCDMTCPTTRALSLHIRYRHLDYKPFSCRYCEHKSKTLHDLNTHLLSHVEGKNFQCIAENCKYSCRCLTSLRWHYRKEHAKTPTYSCHICDERFYRGAALTKHLVGKHDFHWPSGHSRFRYKEDEDGLFRLQTVRYESLEVTQQMMNSDYDISTSVSGRRFFVERQEGAQSSSAVASFIIKTGEDSDENVDEPSYPSEGRANGGKASMPVLTDNDDVSMSAKKVLISVEEVDSSGKVLKTKTLEAEEVGSVGPPESARAIQDGICLFK